MIAPAIKKPQSDWAKQVKICVSQAAKHIKPIIEYIVMSYKVGVLAALALFVVSGTFPNNQHPLSPQNHLPVRILISSGVNKANRSYKPQTAIARILIASSGFFNLGT